MPLHRLNSLVIGVPNVEETAAYYRDFGLARDHGGWFATRDGGRQLKILHAPTRRLVEISIGVDDTDDLERISRRLAALDLQVKRDGDALVTGNRPPPTTAPAAWNAPTGVPRAC
jgi:hypothetical protein